MVAKIPVVLDESTPQLQELTTPDTLNIPADTAITGNISVTGTVDGRDVATDGTKLDTVDTNAADDQTGAEIKTAYESEADTNAYTDAEKTVVGNTSGTNTGDQSLAFTADVDTQITPTTPIVLDHSTNNEIALEISYTANKAAGNDTGLLINQTDTASPGTSLLADFQVGGVSLLKINNSGKVYIDEAGTGSSASGIQFGGSSEVLFYRQQPSVVVVKIGGSDTWKYTSAELGNTAAGRPAFRNTTASATAANIIPNRSDADTGIGSAAADQLSLIAGGIEGARIEEGNNGTVGAHIFIPNLTTAPTGNPTGGGYMYVESGALKYRGSSGTVTTLGPA